MEGKSNLEWKIYNISIHRNGKQPAFKSEYINGNYYSFAYAAQPSAVATLPVVLHNKINSFGFYSKKCADLLAMFVTLVSQYFTLNNFFNCCFFFFR